MMKREGSFTVKELINALSKVDQNLIVTQLGCDCSGRWNGELTEEKDYYFKGEEKIYENNILLGRDD
jgi:hypothetical protein